MYIVGISCYYHNSSAALMYNGKILCAAEEERFSRIKNDSNFPSESVKFCLNKVGITLSDIDYIVFYEKPLLKLDRILEIAIKTVPWSIVSFYRSMPKWIGKKIFLKKMLVNELEEISNESISHSKILFTEHHQSHAASTFYTSKFNESLILCMDGVGEWATTSVWLGSGNSMKLVKKIDFPHSLGLLYSSFTYFCGFKVNEGEYKLMGLAPYGEPKYVDIILSELIDVRDDGSFKLNMKYFNYQHGLSMTNRRFGKLFDCLPRTPESEINQIYMDLAASIQQVLETVVIRMLKSLKTEFNCKNLSLAGGVALNCVLNSRIKDEGLFEDIWVQPAAGDSGGSIGACYSVWHQFLNNDRIIDNEKPYDTLLGPSFNREEIIEELIKKNLKYVDLGLDKYDICAEKIANGNVVGWFQGAMEFGPRALGNRSILADPRNSNMQKMLNLKIKKRESFRPFAPAVLEEYADDYFISSMKSPYMLFTRKIKEEFRIKTEKRDELNKSDIIPAVTHIDYSSRIQTVSKDNNSTFYNLIEKFNKQTGIPILINTSFNVRGEPIVCTPLDAINCFLNTEMDYLILENIMVSKDDLYEA